MGWMRGVLLMAATLLGSSSSVTAQWAAPWGELHEEGVTTSPELDALLTRLFAGAPGAAGLAVSGNGRAARFGVRNEFPFDQMVPIGSGSRWLVAATVLALVERGKLDLDASLARWLGEFDRPDKRQITLRQCLSC
ncbi:MAG: serine hydrolase domain-containing protein, partial [Planctomycetota bacterium]|nr:serine hydrolase domain-containing protein [Planctomycetota bacterium]